MYRLLAKVPDSALSRGLYLTGVTKRGLSLSFGGRPAP